MSVFGLLRTSTSGLAAQSSRLGAVADNVANASTHGYKRAFTEFSSVVLESGSGEYVPGSVATDIRYEISRQGGFDFTTSATDLAVDGDGFFLVGDGAEGTLLTRAGSFVQDADGQLVNAAGYQLLGYSLEGGTPAISANGTAGLEPVNIASLALTATPTTSGTLVTTLPSEAEVVTAAKPADNDALSEYSNRTSLVLYNSFGTEVLVDVYFTKTNDNEWDVTIYDRNDAASTTAPFPYANPALSSATLTFDPAVPRQLDASSATTITFTVPDGADVTLDLSEISQLDTDFQVTADLNGNAPSGVESIEFGDDGTLYSIFGNGARVASFRIPLATVVSPDNLTPVAGNAYQLSADSGELQVGLPGVGSFGNVRSSALEKSTVDTATELTTMIEAQYAYVANSKVFQTGTELLEVLVNLKR